MKIEAVVLYSSNDHVFANACITSLLELKIKTHVVTYTHMWRGDLENQELLDNTLYPFKNNPLFNYYQIEWTPGNSPWYWEGTGRYLATQQVSDNTDYILYIDVDEIIDVDGFKKWELDGFQVSNTWTNCCNGNIFQYDTIKLADYWYWREPIYRSKSVEYNTVMAKTSLAKSIPNIPGGRNNYTDHGSCGFTDQNNTFIHHYSWVRNKEQMINKVSNWGHTHDRNNWVEKVNEEFSRPFNGCDFMHGYQYDTVENKFNIQL